MQRVHFQVRVGVFNCQKILATISFVTFDLVIQNKSKVVSERGTGEIHWALALVKGNREPHEAKKKFFDLGGNRTHDLRNRSTVTLPTELQGRIEKVGDDFRR